MGVREAPEVPLPPKFPTALYQQKRIWPNTNFTKMFGLSASELRFSDCPEETKKSTNVSWVRKPLSNGRSKWVRNFSTFSLIGLNSWLGRWLEALSPLFTSPLFPCRQLPYCRRNLSFRQKFWRFSYGSFRLEAHIFLYSKSNNFQRTAPRLGFFLGSLESFLFQVSSGLDAWLLTRKAGEPAPKGEFMIKIKKIE